MIDRYAGEKKVWEQDRVAHSIRIDRVRTKDVKVPNRMECAMSQSTFVCGLNPVRSGLE